MKTFTISYTISIKTPGFRGTEATVEAGEIYAMDAEDAIRIADKMKFHLKVKAIATGNVNLSTDVEFEVTKIFADEVV